MSSSKLVTIFIDKLPILKKLNLSDKLSIIREELEKNEDDINNDILLFLKKVNDGFYEIGREQENKLLLNDIITVDNDLNILYLKRNFHCKYECKLDYGRTMSFDGMKLANKIAFKMKDYKLKLIGTEKYKKGTLVFESVEDWMKKTNLFFSTDIDANSVGLGLLIGKLKNKNFDNETKLTYRYIEFSKASLKFSKEDLELTDDFKDDVIKAIKSKNPREEFKKIIEEYGQIIPTEFIFGGRVYFKDGDISSKSKFYKFNRWKLLGGKHTDEEKFDEKYWIESLKNYQNWDCIEFKNPINIFKLLPDDLRKEVFEAIGRRILYTSIENYDYNLNKPGMPNIYELDKLPQNISKIIQDENADCDFFAAVVDTEDSRNIFFNCQILRPTNGKPSIIIHCAQKKFRERKYKLKIGLIVIGYDMDFELILSDISVEVVKKNYDSQNPCEFFGIPLEQKWNLGLIKASGNPFFGIPILNYLDSSNKSLIIGHNFRNTQIDTFSYSLETKCYENLPKFTFCTFIILLNNPTSNAFELHHIKFVLFRDPFIDLEGGFFWFYRKMCEKYEELFKKQTSISRSNSSSSLNPKYISLYLSNDDHYKPIFLKQKLNRISLKYVDCNCKGTCHICTVRSKEISKNNNNSCVLFDPNISD